MTDDSGQVLFLGPATSPVLRAMRESGDQVVQTEDAVTADGAEGFGFLVSHGFRHLLRRELLELFPRRAVNLHISYLPYNRGADPNFWSWVDGTPKGVTIHLIDDGLDTGDVVVQHEVAFGAGETLTTSYRRLQDEMVALFMHNWPALRSGSFPTVPQAGEGTAHRAAERAAIWDRFPLGWDTPVAQLEESA